MFMDPPSIFSLLWWVLIKAKVKVVFHSRFPLMLLLAERHSSPGQYGTRYIS